MRVLAAMSGGVDSSVAAALLVEQGHDVVGVTMKLWRYPTDTGCCSAAEVDDARRVAQQLGIDHWVFSFTDDFDSQVVDPYVDAHAAGLTPNPCIECNRSIKFDRLLRRADQLGFDAIASGHYARVEHDGSRWRLRRAVDDAKDQSYVLYVLTQQQLGRVLFPLGAMTKTEVRARARALGLRTADKAESQEVCFVTASGGREALLSSRLALTPAKVVERDGSVVGTVDAVELVTIGQRRGLGIGGGRRRYALDVDRAGGTVVVGDRDDLLADAVVLGRLSWVDEAVTGDVQAQSSAHGAAVAATFDGRGVVFVEPQRRVAPGQSVVLYDGEYVLGGGIAER